ncbi:MAG TPA: CsgE family curli-type amyloid fiber assembly protein, partial [Flavobacterium sp.]|nr:CsgE family curli-type amyloid fiber assembly protein [Flavobacterium sp.]
VLSKTQVNISKEDETILLLLIYDEDDKIIGKDRIVVGETDKAEQPADGLELIGIVSDETKTKFGKEFYDYFYGKYQEKKLNARKIVKIEEELSFGRTTRIRVVIDNDLINEFVSRPDEDFLLYMAEDSIAKLIKYFQDVEKQKNYITQY